VVQVIENVECDNAPKKRVLRDLADVASSCGFVHEFTGHGKTANIRWVTSYWIEVN
jgi:hypothetical protein